jgi:disulfide bond formation protein DsbB
MNSISKRQINLLGFAVCAGLLGFGYYLQFFQGLEPCPLCIFQRVAFISLGGLFLLAGLHNPGRLGARLYGVMITVAGLTGAGISSWHVYIQNLPPEKVPECGPGLDYMLEAFNFSETLKMVFTGSGECHEVTWSLLGLSMPAWALICFLGLGLMGLIWNWRNQM